MGKSIVKKVDYIYAPDTCKIKNISTKINLIYMCLQYIYENMFGIHDLFYLRKQRSFLRFIHELIFKSISTSKNID